MRAIVLDVADAARIDRLKPSNRFQQFFLTRTRDARDAQRTVAPLRPAEDAVLIDTTGLAIEKVVERVLALVQAP